MAGRNFSTIHCCTLEQHRGTLLTLVSNKYELIDAAAYAITKTMSRRNVLEDSDSEDNPGGTAAGISASPNTTFFSAEEHLAINICNIQVNNGGRFSNECMQSAIASIGEPPFELLPKKGETIDLNIRNIVSRRERRRRILNVISTRFIILVVGNKKLKPDQRRRQFFSRSKHYDDQKRL